MTNWRRARPSNDVRKSSVEPGSFKELACPYPLYLKISRKEHQRSNFWTGFKV